MGKKRNFQGREAFHRMNFLYQAAHLLKVSPSSAPAANSCLAAYYGNIMTGVAKKTVLRIDPTIKRTICKGCHSPLIPSRSMKVKVKKQNAGQMELICTVCHTLKRFSMRRDYQIWAEKEESVVETFLCGNEDSDAANTMTLKECDQQKDSVPKCSILEENYQIPSTSKDIQN